MAYGFGRLMNHQAIIPLEILCTEMMDDAFGQDFVDDVDTIIKDLPKLRSTRDSTVMAQKLIDLLVQQQLALHQPAPTIPPVPPSQEQTGIQEEQQNLVTSGNSSSNEEIQGQPSISNKQQLQVQKGKRGRSGKQETTVDDKKSENKIEAGQASGFGGSGASSGGGNRPSPEEIEELLKNKSVYGDLSALIQSELDELAESTPVKAGIPELPDIGRLKSSHGKLDEVEAVSASSRMRARLMGLLQSIKMQPQSYGLSGRKLASGRLVKMGLGDPRIFRKKIEKFGVNTAVIVLLDLSGSMAGRYEIANAAAYALHLTLYGLKGVAVCSLEFSGKDNQPEVSVLVDFGLKPKSENFNHHPFDGTPTDTAIWAGRALLLQRPEPRKIMLILTDGSPDNGQETREATKRTMQDGIEIAAIGIMANSVKNYWDNHKIIEVIQELPAAMFGIMEGLLIKSNNPYNSSNQAERDTP
jgi:cobalamin biosynthesis protein CobT